MMCSVPTDVELIVHRFIHSDQITQLHKEYLKSVCMCGCVWSVCDHSIAVSLKYGPRLLWNSRDSRVLYQVKSSLDNGFNTKSMFTTQFIGICNSKGQLCSDFPKNY